uniref:Glycosyltransferase n=1 Tax=viral metagenome TaxID=1070528 RepID=A0A6C0J3P6_9ZZZZ
MDYNIAFLITLKNYDRFLKYFNKLKYFPNLTVIFVYDDNDKLDNKFTNFKKESKFKVIYKKIKNTSKFKTIRISNARNKCLEILDKLKHIDYHFVIDCNKINCMEWNINIFKKYLKEDTWDCLSFNRWKYYDIWALMYENIYHHCWGYNSRNICKKVIKVTKNDIKKKLSELKNNELFPCLSAFNGLAIYRTKKFKGIKYDGEYKNLKTIISDEQRDKTLNFLKNKWCLRDKKLEINENKVESCEHLFYHLSAIKENNCRIRISKFSKD